MAFLIGQRIVRPGYTTLQTHDRGCAPAERQRLEQRVEAALDEVARAAMQKLLVREDTLSELAAVKQDAKHFRHRMMVMERQKRATLVPLYAIAKALLPNLDISQRNIDYYASLANYYTIYDLRRLKPGQTYLYLLCYAWQRYRQLSDNLVDALGYHMKQLKTTPRKLPTSRPPRLKPSNNKQRHGSASYSCCMWTMPSKMPRPSARCVVRLSASCRKRLCFRPASAYAKNLLARWSYAGSR